MKSIFRWGAALGVVGSAIAGSALTSNMQALALPQEQVLQKLASVPVFTITDSKGAPLVATPPTNAQNQNARNQSPVAGVFISQRDAQAFVEGLKKSNPQLASTVRVVPVPLGEVYKLDQANQNQANSLDIAYIPTKQQFDAALTLLRQSGSNSELRKACEQNKRRLEDCVGTPLFVARAGKEKGYLTMKINRPPANNQPAAAAEVIPFYFNKEELQGMLERFKQQRPELASTVDIQVLNLEGMLEILKTRNDEGVRQIVLVPPQESIQYVRSLQQSTAGGARPQPQRPAAQPAAPNRPNR